MFERLKQVLSRPPRQASPNPPDKPGQLDWITGETPYRFRTWLADPDQRDDAVVILERKLGHELTITVANEPDGRVRLDLVSTFPMRAAIVRPLNVLRSEGVRVQGLEILDLVEDVEDAELVRLAQGWDDHRNAGSYRRRIEQLTGPAIIERMIDAQRRNPKASGFRFVATTVAHGTVGSEALMLWTAVDTADPTTASWYAGAAAGRGTLAELVGTPFDPPEDAVVALARRRDRVAETAWNVAGEMKAPLSEELTSLLCAAVRRGGVMSTGAVRALRKAPPTAEVQETLESALESPVADVRDVTLGVLGELLGTGARPYWEAWFASTSAPNRMAAEDAIGQFGDADDVPLAAEQLGKIIRRKSSTTFLPPRGNHIINLLVRHRELPEARAALADLTKRWPKLPEELQAWLKEYHPDLVPPETAAPVADNESSDEAEQEPPLTWPLPEIKRDGSEVSIGFWDTDLSDIHDRFEELLEAHPAVTIVDGDREWTTARFDVPDPEGLIAELWARAQVPPNP